MLPLGSDAYGSQVALDQWANDGDSAVQNLVALVYCSHGFSLSQLLAALEPWQNLSQAKPKQVQLS